MDFSRVLITGGAGFVGANLASMLKQRFSHLEVTALDNLKRQGSQLNLERLREQGVRFCHGDVRCSEDLEAAGGFDLIIDCAAEPSVQAGVGHSPRYVLNTNLVGTINCLEAGRRHAAAVLFLSTSRVYPLAALNGLPYDEDENRFRWDSRYRAAGFSEHGIAETFTLDGPRSFYGASKLAGELLVQEYVHQCDVKAVINRCGILAGPWQMGKADQGVISLWVARHYFEQPLTYIGYGGHGKQVRDALHIRDLFDLIVLQLERPAKWDGSVYNVGGGPACSVSLKELTQLCRQITGKQVPVGADPETSEVDVPIYLTDARKVRREFGWYPRHRVPQIVQHIHDWMDSHRPALRPILAPEPAESYVLAVPASTEEREP